MSFLKKLVGAAEGASEIVAGIIGGPAAGAAVKGGINAANKAFSHNAAPAVFVPSSARSIDDARQQDRTRMKSRYGVPIEGPGGDSV